MIQPLLDYNTVIVENGAIQCLGTYVSSMGKQDDEKDNITHISTINDFSQYEQILANDNINDNTFHILKEICSFFPVRTKGKRYQKHCMGLYHKELRDKIVKEHNINQILRRYTSEGNWFCTRINIYLALDAEPLTKYSDYIKELKCCIGWQKPKHSGLCYRGARMCATEIGTYMFKECFYIPSFTSTSTVKSVALNNFKGNTLFEIDTSEFNNFTTLIKPEQTKYTAESENLISCYNVYQYIGYTYDPNDTYVTLKLKLVNYDLANDIETHSIKGAEHGNLPEGIIKGSDEKKDRNVSAKDLNDHLIFLKRYIDGKKKK